MCDGVLCRCFCFLREFINSWNYWHSTILLINCDLCVPPQGRGVNILNLWLCSIAPHLDNVRRGCSCSLVCKYCIVHSAESALHRMLKCLHKWSRPGDQNSGQNVCSIQQSGALANSTTEASSATKAAVFSILHCLLYFALRFFILHRRTDWSSTRTSVS